MNIERADDLIVAIDIKPINNHIFNLEFDSQKELCDTFCRLQEHYESPNDEFRKRPFTLGEYREWYKATYGGWTYNTDWAGFNMPDYAFKDFFDGKFDPLDESETYFLSIIAKFEPKFYVIGTYKGADPTVIDHEITHGMYKIKYPPELREKLIALKEKYSAASK